MACIIKFPHNGCKGVVSFTTQERDQVISKSSKTRILVESLKSEWFLGMHHNWHDFQFHYDDLYDFHLAGEGDLIEAGGRQFALAPFDACSFVPGFFKPDSTTKIWDVLLVGRAVYFKRIPVFFEAVRRLFDQGQRLRVLQVCSIPEYSWKDRKSVFYGIRKEYDSLFNEEEKDFFTLLTTNYRYPFPFDLSVLEGFYRLSKVFVHTASDERRCRVAAYAWASGMSVVGMSCVGSILPPHLAKPPFFYQVDDDSQYVDQISRAVNDWLPDRKIFNCVRECVSEDFTRAKLVSWLEKFFHKHLERFDLERFHCDKLDFRMGRHHGISIGKNKVPMDIDSLAEVLSDRSKRNAIPGNLDDPETWIARHHGRSLEKKTGWGWWRATNP
jgi:glycosyltransferase involved in cell wall biosynthesis